MHAHAWQQINSNVNPKGTKWKTCSFLTRWSRRNGKTKLAESEKLKSRVVKPDRLGWRELGWWMRELWRQKHVCVCLQKSVWNRQKLNNFVRAKLGNFHTCVLFCFHRSGKVMFWCWQMCRTAVNCCTRTSRSNRSVFHTQKNTFLLVPQRFTTNSQVLFTCKFDLSVHFLTPTSKGERAIILCMCAFC